MPMTESSPSEVDADRTIVTTRVLGVARELVFRAFSDPDHLARWWGPKGFTNAFHEFAMRPGGFWRFVMRNAEGREFENESVFLEVVPPELIVFRHHKPMHEFQNTFIFAEHDGGTRLTWLMRFQSSAECETVRRFVVPANEQNLDRLEAQLALMT